MTKEEWFDIRTQDEIPMDVWYEYYKERGGIIQSIEEFERVFVTMLWMPSSLTFDSSIKSLYRYYDKKFEI